MTTCIQKALVDAHFDGTISPGGEARLRAHLGTCASCTEYYDRRVLLARLDPEALPMEERLAIGLGFAHAGERGGAAEVSPWRARGLWLLGLVAAAAVLLLWFIGSRPNDGGFAARGGPPGGAPYVRVFRAAKGGEPAPLAGPMLRTDELAFAYESTPGNDHLMIFGVDEHGHVFWYHPAWTDPTTDPAAVPVPTSAELHPLREAIGHDLDGRTLEIHALFSHEARTVRTIEAMLGGKKAPFGKLDLPATTDVVQVIEVTP